MNSDKYQIVIVYDSEGYSNVHSLMREVNTLIERDWSPLGAPFYIPAAPGYSGSWNRAMTRD